MRSVLIPFKVGEQVHVWHKNKRLRVIIVGIQDGLFSRTLNDRVYIVKTVSQRTYRIDCRHHKMISRVKIASAQSPLELVECRSPIADPFPFLLGITGQIITLPSSFYLQT